MNHVTPVGFTNSALLVMNLLDFLRTHPSKDQVRAKVAEIEKTHPSTQDKTKIIDELAEAIVRDHLLHLKRRHVYQLRMSWSETFASYRHVKPLFDAALAQVEQSDLDARVRKSAKTVQIVVIQAKILYALTRTDLTKEERYNIIVQLIDSLLDKKVPLHKILKNYHSITYEKLNESLRAKLKYCVIENMIRRQSGSAVTSDTVKLLEQMMMTDTIILSDIVKTIDFFCLPKEWKSYFTHADTLCNIFSGKEPTQTLEDIEKAALNEGLSAVDLFNFAIELFYHRKGTPNSLTTRGKEIAFKSVSKHVVDLVNRFYQSYQEDKSDVFVAIMHEVDQLNLGPQFSDCLRQLLSKHVPTSQKDTIIQSIGAIYDAMYTLGTHLHHMKPSELMQCAQVAECTFRKSRISRPTVFAGVTPRTFVYDPQQKAISFINKSKGGKAPLFGSVKEVHSAITISKTASKDGIPFIAQTKRAATLKKDLIASDLDADLWLRELETLKVNKGLEGLLSYESIATYSQKVGQLNHKRVLIIMKDYDFGTCVELLKGTALPFQAITGYFVSIAKGLCNLHFPPDDGVKRRPRVHGDLNPRNMFLAVDGTAVIGDFGFVTYPTRSESLPLLIPYYGSIGYSDPEVTIVALQAKECGKSAKDAVATLDLFALDCFAMGVTMYYILHGRLPQAMSTQRTHYKAETMSLSQAIAIKEQHLSDHEVQYSALEKLTDRTLQQEFEIIAWMLMHPNAKLRLNAPSLLACLQELQASHQSL